VNRLYYAAFYAARALLATRDVDAARHSGLITVFQQHFVKTGLVPAETGKVLARAFEKRQASDYGDFATIDPARHNAHKNLGLALAGLGRFGGPPAVCWRQIAAFRGIDEPANTSPTCSLPTRRFSWRTWISPPRAGIAGCGSGRWETPDNDKMHRLRSDHLPPRRRYPRPARAHSHVHLHLCPSPGSVVG
jgi:HEPN domain